MVFARTTALGLSPAETEERLAQESVLVNHMPESVRFVTHIDVSDDDVDRALAAWRTLASSAGGAR